MMERGSTIFHVGYQLANLEEGEDIVHRYFNKHIANILLAKWYTYFTMSSK